MITKDSNVEDVIARYPDAVKIFLRYGLPCLVCGEPFWGTIAELAERYSVDLDSLISELRNIEDGR